MTTQVQNELLADNSVGTTKLATNAVTYGKLASDVQGSLYSFKNRIINGAMMIDQRNAGASVSTASNFSGYATDRWGWQVTSLGKITLQQNAGSITPPSGFKNYLGITSTSAYSVGASDYFAVIQAIEGLNVADLNWGSASAVAVTISFWVRSSLTGTFGGVVYNSAFNRSYPFTYTISSANTWEQKTITIAGDTTGTWATDNTGGLYLSFGLGVGSTLAGTAGSWAASGYRGATGATSVVGTNGATFYITGVQLEKGSTATSFDYRPYGTELQLAQRYCRPVSSAPGLSGSTVSCQISIQHTGMRAAPSATTTAALIVTNITSANYTQSSGSITIAENNADGGRYNLANFTGMTSGAAAYLISSGGTVLLTAEL